MAMTVVHEIRDERDDVYSFWKIVKTVAEDTDVITRTNTMIEETTIAKINETIAKMQADKTALTKSINKEQEKLALIAAL